MTVVEFRTRSKRAPGGELRIFLGRPSNRRERRELEARRDVLSRLAGGLGTSCAPSRTSEYTPEEIERLVDEHGIEDFKAHLPTTDVSLPVPSLDQHKDQWLRTLDEKRQPLSANVRETRSRQRIRVGRKQRNGPCWD